MDCRVKPGNDDSWMGRTGRDLMAGGADRSLRMTAEAEAFAPPRKTRREIPYWLIAAALLAVLFFWLIVADSDYRVIFHALRQGVLVTLWVTIVAFALAALLGLVV